MDHAFLPKKKKWIDPVLFAQEREGIGKNSYMISLGMVKNSYMMSAKSIDPPATFMNHMKYIQLVMY